MTMEPIWRETLLAAARRDLETRERLVRDGSLFDGYHPEMEAVHLENAALLEAGPLTQQEIDAIRTRWSAIADSSWVGQV